VQGHGPALQVVLEDQREGEGIVTTSSDLVALMRNAEGLGIGCDHVSADQVEALFDTIIALEADKAALQRLVYLYIDPFDVDPTDESMIAEAAAAYAAVGGSHDSIK